MRVPVAVQHHRGGQHCRRLDTRGKGQQQTTLRRSLPVGRNALQRNFLLILFVGVRKAAKNGRQNDLDSLADVLRLTNTRRARSAQHDVGGRLPGWVNKFKWQEGRDWVKVVPEFRTRTGGGNGGVGLVQSAVQQIYTWCQP